ncbi:MutS2 family protein [Chloroherpeton thalassium ATCC 35110]|uniref:Endonuclease MutS2 n=1 Tax=Chloroherpeton thalassium (strain ATCC 35110 / GB-78) TaxID=517418 RepID=B3QWV7_CHLT3|nr:endonuclease MutS2 [Chloroherpeton thalassium]ACF13321.1 MutS2 family protein [Chloroherpeton thalassium ATCC 35110]
MDLKKKLEFDKVLEHTKRFALSNMGREKLDEQTPAQSLTKLDSELRKVHELKLLFESGEELPIPAFPDTRDLLKKLGVVAHFLEPKELLSLAMSLRVASQLKKFIFNRRETYPHLNALTENLWIEKTLQYEIGRIVDESGEVRNTASDALAFIRSSLIEKRELLRRKMDSLLRRYAEQSMLMDDSVTIRNGRLVLGFRIEHKYQIQGFIHDISQSGQTVFIEPSATLTVNNEIRDLEIQESREIVRILREMSERLGEERENLFLNQEVLAEFDAIYAKAKLALATGAAMPMLGEEKSVRLNEAFHPWLLISNRKQEKRTVPISLELGTENRVLVISGPNAGGKSVAMKTVGLLCLMLQHGFLLPCREDSVFPIFDRLFVEIGDEQSIENDLSTFSSHLRNLKEILDNATNESLVLIDEICSGTDPDEGSALATAVLESLLSRKALGIVTTHQGTLKAYAHNRDGITNGSMQYDTENLLPTYVFQPNLPGNSFALEMARRMKFPPHVMENAAKFMGETRHRLESLITDLSREIQVQSLEKYKFENERKEYERLKAEYQQKLTELEEERKSLRQKSLQDAKRVLADANQLIEKAVADVRESQADKDAVKQARRDIEKKRRELAVNEAEIFAEQKSAPVNMSIDIGDKVKLQDTHTVGEVIDITDDDVTVAFGSFRMKTSLRKLEKVSNKEARKMERQGEQQKISVSTNYDTEMLSTRLDLRGLLGDEAILRIDKFIDATIANKLHRVDIIHGKGTGALRKRVMDYLKGDKRVKSFRLGNWDEGGAGVTVVDVVD